VDDLQLWGAVMLGVNGYQPYMDFLEGNGDAGAVRSAFETTAEMLENHIGDDAASIGLTQSNQNIINGDAAFIHQGNWAAGAFRNAENFEVRETTGASRRSPGPRNVHSSLRLVPLPYPSDNPAPGVPSKTWEAFAGSPEPRSRSTSTRARRDSDRREHGGVRSVPPGDGRGLRERGTDRRTFSTASASPRDDDGAQRRHLFGFTGPYNVDAATALNAVSN